MNVIKFSHDYPKLWGQSEAMLIAVRYFTKTDFPLNEDLLEYDTKTKEGNFYPLPKGDYLQLIFLGNKRIPFCSIRKNTPGKDEYYNSKLNQEFKIEIMGQVKP